MSASAIKTDASGLPWALYICKACGLIYDESKGDEDSGLAAGTRFTDIPDDWACPLCGVTKADFEPYAVQAVAIRRSADAERSQPARQRQNAGAVIVGAGRAGWQIAQALRSRDAHFPITLVTSCSGDVYDKPMLSVAIARAIDIENLPRETGNSAAARLGVTLLANTHAVRIAPASHQLRTSRGTLRYQHLVLAHGAQSRSLPQLPDALCWRINHLQVYTQFRKALGDQPRRIAIVGAGLIGCELANDLAIAGHYVTLLDVAARPLASMLQEAQSQQLLSAWRSLPLKFVGGVQIKSTNAQHPSGEKVITTECGQSLAVDHIVVAAGLQTPTRLAATAGLAWNNGIDVHPQTLATSVKGIYALGDCISIDGHVSRYIEPIGRQAQTIAANILNATPRPYQQLAAPLRIKTTSLAFTV